MSGMSSIVVDSEIGVTKADELGNKEAPCSFTGEINNDVTANKAEAGNKAEEARKAMVTEVHWIEFVFPIKPPLPVGKAEPPTGAMITKERVPDAFVDRLKSRRVFRRMRPFDDPTGVFAKFPKMRDSTMATVNRWNTCIDLHEDVLRQLEEKGFAEVGVDFTDGVKKIFVLPEPQPEPK